MENWLMTWAWLFGQVATVIATAFVTATLTIAQPFFAAIALTVIFAQTFAAAFACTSDYNVDNVTFGKTWNQKVCQNNQVCSSIEQCSNKQLMRKDYESLGNMWGFSATKVTRNRRVRFVQSSFCIRRILNSTLWPLKSSPHYDFGTHARFSASKNHSISTSFSFKFWCFPVQFQTCFLV